jgi:probable F420-dependent oxidoreductase
MSLSAAMPADGVLRPLKIGLFLPSAETMLDGATAHWGDIQALAQLAEDAGFDSLWFPDHLLFERSTGTFGAWECWTLLAAVAAVTRRISLGPFVSSMSFRNPALLAKMADTVDDISGGRLILALGAGWHQPEYRAFGYPFDYRASRFAEGIEIIHTLLRTGEVDFAGTFYKAHECLLRPRGPQGSRLPIMIGTKGERMLRLAARYADSWNVDWVLPEALTALHAAIDAACIEVGRDPSTLERTASVQIDLPGVERHPFRGNAGQVSGSTEELAALMRSYAAAGITHVQVWLAPNTAAGIEAFAPVLALLDRG